MVHSAVARAWFDWDESIRRFWGFEKMRKLALTAMTAAVTLMSVSAMAADLKMAAKAAPPPPPPSPWDIAFGGYVASDYIWRGITQSNHKPSVSAYTELRYNSSPMLQWYAGVSGESISFPNQAAAEIDLYGGVRPTFGALALDFGYWYYYYPGGTCYDGGVRCLAAPLGNFVAKSEWSFWEVYAKGVWTVNDQWALGFNVFGTSNILNTGASGTYVSGTVKYTAPSSAALGGAIGWYVSGEFGEQFLGTSDHSTEPVPARSSQRARPMSTTPHGTSASASPGKCSRLTCATTTPTCRRASARFTPATTPQPSPRRPLPTIRPA